MGFVSEREVIANDGCFKVNCIHRFSLADRRKNPCQCVTNITLKSEEIHVMMLLLSQCFIPKGHFA